jgi:hypothetical protein
MRDVRAVVKVHPVAVRTATAAVALVAAMFVQGANTAAEYCPDFCFDACDTACASHGGCYESWSAPDDAPPFACLCSGWCSDGTYWS